MATEHKKESNSVNKLICFKCGGYGHVMRKCTLVSKFPICTICKKSHHVKAHDIATKMTKDKLSRAYSPVKDNDTIAYMTEEELQIANMDQLEQSASLDELVAAQLSITNDFEDDDDIIDSNHSYIYEGYEEEFGGMSMIVDNDNNEERKKSMDNNRIDNKKQINNNNKKKNDYNKDDNAKSNNKYNNDLDPQDDHKVTNDINNKKQHDDVKVNRDNHGEDNDSNENMYNEDSDYISYNHIKLNNINRIKPLGFKSSIDNKNKIKQEDKMGRIVNKNELNRIFSLVLFRLVEFLLGLISRLEGKKDMRVCKEDDMWEYMERKNNMDNGIKEEEEYFSDEE